MRIFLSHQFEKNYKNLPKKIKLLLQKKEDLFRKNPYNPSLKTHHLGGLLKDLSSFSVNYSYRVLFRFIDKERVIFYDVGTHSIYQ